MLSKGTNSVTSSIFHVWESCLTARRQYCDEKDPHDPSRSRLDALFYSALNPIIAEHDALADRLGRNFANGDNLFELDLQAIANSDLLKLHDLICGQTTVPPSGPANNANSKNPFMATSATLRPPLGNSAEPNPGSKDWEVEVDGLARAASEKTVKALQDLASRLGYVPSTNRDPLLSKLPHSSFGANDVAYCKGALLLQKSESDIYSIVERQSSEQHFVCKYCYLEISDFQWNPSNHATEHWSLLASCHVLACPSLKDRRAAYRCFTCFSHGHNVIEPSAAAIRQHLDTCKPRMISSKGTKNLHGTRKDQYSPDEQSEQTAYLPPLSLDKPARGSLASLHTQHASRPSNTTTPVTNPQPDARDGVCMPDQIMLPIPRRPAPPAPSSVFADRTVPPVPPLPKSILLRAAITAEQNDGDSGARGFISLPGSFPSPGPLTAHAPRTPQHPKTGQPSTPTQMTTPTSPASSANWASISNYPEDTTNRGRPNSSQRHHQHNASSPTASEVLPLPAPIAAINGASDAAEVAKINGLLQLGIPRARAESLLRTTRGNIDEAAELAFSSGPIGGSVVEDQPPPPPRELRRSGSRSRRWLDRLT